MPRQNEGEEQGPLAEYERGLRIDKNDLDTALIQQPDIFYRVAKELTLAISRRDEMKLNINEAIADLDQQIRSRSEKTTEGGIAKEIDSAPKIIDLRRDYGRLNHKVDRWTALKEAYQSRSYVLKDLCGLYVAGYFSTQSGGGARNDARTRLADEARTRVAEAREATPQSEGRRRPTRAE
jgi:hypothetical protein